MSLDQVSLLSNLEPICALSPGRIKELADLCVVETVSRGLDPFRMNVVQNEQLLYLLQGDLKIAFRDGKTSLLQSGRDAARHPVAPERASVIEAVAMTDIQILRIDADLLDIMLTWDQLAGYEKAAHKTQKQTRSPGEWMESTGAFSAESLKNGIFRALPPANVEEMFRRMERIHVAAGQVIIQQGDEGDYYYLIESGSADVARATDAGALATIAQLHAGNAFGEEALVSGSRRNATVTMLAAGTLLRLGKDSFAQLLKTPLLNVVGLAEAKRLLAKGAVLLDVRLQSEFNFGHYPMAINIPLNQIRELMGTLDQDKQYITYCNSGRRASAAAFLLAQHRFNVKSIKRD